MAHNSKRVNIMPKRVEDSSKNISVNTSQYNHLQNSVINENIQVMIEKDENSKSNLQDDNEQSSSQKINTSGMKKKLMMKDLISTHTHYKIGMNEELDQLMKKGKRNSLQTIEQEQDLDGWFKKQQAQKISNDIFQEEEESKKEMKHKLLDDLLIQDTPELNLKIISSIMRDRVIQQQLLSQKSNSNMQSDFGKSPLLKKSMKKLLQVRNMNKELFSEDQNEGQKEGPLHITAATSANLLRIYNPYMVIENQEVKKRLKTENIINNIIIDKVKKEELKLKKLISSNSTDSSTIRMVKSSTEEFNKKKQLTIGAAEMEDEEKQKIQRLIDIGKEQARNTLKNFKGLQNFYLENILQNDNIKRQLEESNKAPKRALFNLKTEVIFAPFMEIEQVYLPKYLGTFEKLKKARADEYELRICIAHQVELIKEKQIEINELQIQLDNVGMTVQNQNNFFKGKQFGSGSSSTLITIGSKQQIKMQQQSQNEMMKVSKRREMLREQISVMSTNVEILKQELQQLENKMLTYKDNIKQLKNVRTKIRTYIKTTLLTMMQKDLTLFINPKKPIDLSLPKIISTLIKIGENVFSENFPQFMDQSQRELVVSIACLEVEVERIKEKDLKQINEIKLPANTQSILSQLSYQCSKQCITLEAEKRIKEITKEILSVKKPIFKLDEGTHTHTMQYENVIQNSLYSKKIAQARMEIEEKKDVVLGRLEKREAITKYLKATIAKIKELEENELDRLEKSVANIKSDQASHLKNQLISIFGIIRGCEQLSYYLQFHKFRKQLLGGNNFTNKEKIDLINNFKEKKSTGQLNDSDSDIENIEHAKDNSDNNHIESHTQQQVAHSGQKLKENPESVQRQQAIKSFQTRNKILIENTNSQTSTMTDSTFYNTFMKSLTPSSSSQLVSAQPKNKFIDSTLDFPFQNQINNFIIKPSDYIIDSTHQDSQLLKKDSFMPSSSQFIYSDRGIMGSSSSRSIQGKSSPSHRFGVGQQKLTKIVSFEQSNSHSYPVTTFARHSSILEKGQNSPKRKLISDF